ncbi:MAG: hypothetical protein RLZZ200_1376 [Pseudomonadota bacterium]|jgi:PAS domain S-box-containing protein
MDSKVLDATDGNAMPTRQPDYAIIFNATTNPMAFTNFATGKFVDVNDAWIRSFGIPKEQALGKTGTQLALWPSLTHREACVSQLARDGRIIQFETEFLVRGNRVPHLVSAQLADMHGETFVLWELIDIAGRRKIEAERAALEAQLLQAQKMEAIGTLAGGVAHEFNNVVAIVLGNSELLREDVGDNVGLQTSVQEIRKAALRGRNLVRQILSFSRRVPVERIHADLVPVVDDAVRLLRATLPTRLALQWEPPAERIETHFDATQIQQIVINLVTNAMQAQPKGNGTIRVSMTRRPLSPSELEQDPLLSDMVAQNPGPYACLVVQDNGPGMNLETQQRIFEPFYTTKPVGEGTGLGLSVVLGIAQGHDGTVRVESAPGAGATFKVFLPMTLPSAPVGSEQVTDGAGQ